MFLKHSYYATRPHSFCKNINRFSCDFSFNLLKQVSRDVIKTLIYCSGTPSKAILKIYLSVGLFLHNNEGRENLLLTSAASTSLDLCETSAGWDKVLP